MLISTFNNYTFLKSKDLTLVLLCPNVKKLTTVLLTDIAEDNKCYCVIEKHTMIKKNMKSKSNESRIKPL